MSRTAGSWDRPGTFPFVAVLGQEEAKLALVLSVVCPDLGGVLLLGEKGTAKSTLARGVAALLGQLRGGGSFVDLPVNAGEERLAGCIDLERALREGRLVFQPGLLARANGGVLYVDEVNLLSDHVADMLLDAAASGEHVFEREGLSLRHESRFLLVGSMNPEEGDLRPQLLDRFGLCVAMGALRDVEARLALLRDLEAFEADARAFAATKSQAGQSLVGRIERARTLYPAVALSPAARTLAVDLTCEACCAGQRAEILLVRAAKAHAAWRCQADATPEDVRAVAEMVLRHRRRMRPSAPPEQAEQPEQTPPPPEQEQEQQEQRRDPPPQAPDQARDAHEEQPPEQDQGEGEASSARAAPTLAQEKVFAVGEPFRLKPIVFRRDRMRRKAGSGRRAPTKTLQRVGRSVGSRSTDKARDLALDATLRAAAPHQCARRASRSDARLAVHVKPCDLREKTREKRMGTLIVLAADASSSMGAGRRMSEAKAAVLSWLLDAYQKRDRIAFVAFRGQEAQVLLPPTSGVERAYRLLEELPTGGKTPLAHGLAQSYGLIERELRRTPSTIPVLVVISDGRANVALNGGKPLRDALDMAERIGRDGRVKCFVVDTEPEHINAMNLAQRLAEALRARHVKIDQLRAEHLVQLFKAGGGREGD